MTYEINSNSRYITLGKSIISKSQKKTRLSNTGITDKEKLEQEVAVKGWWWSRKLMEECVCVR
jgi:hypothetical protein